MYRSIIPPLRLVFLMWLVFTIEAYSGSDLGFLGIHPRTLWGLIGVFTAPLIHGTTDHLISNTFPLLFLGTTLYLFYERIATQVFLQCYFFTNMMVWIFARPFYHIGASGLVYALASFLIWYGLFRKDAKAIVVSVVVILLYGGLIYGIFPSDPLVSYESHLFGAIVGLGSAYSLSRIKRVKN